MTHDTFPIPRTHLPAIKGMARRWVTDYSQVVHNFGILLRNTLSEQPGLPDEIPALGQDPVQALQAMELAVSRGIVAESVADMQALRRGLEVMETVLILTDTEADARRGQATLDAAKRRFLGQHPAMDEGDLNPDDLLEIAELAGKRLTMYRRVQADTAELEGAVTGLRDLVGALEASRGNEPLPPSNRPLA